MAWNGSFKPFTTQAAQPTFTFFHNYDYLPFPGLEQGLGIEEVKFGSEAELIRSEEQLGKKSSSCNDQKNMERKKRLRNDQIEMLERSFQEEIKLEPERKMRLARDLGLQPRQVAVWFQNRRARWKTKHLQHVYDALKLDYEAISLEKQKLQGEVMKLKARLAAAVNQGSTDYTEVSPEDTMESTSAVICNSSNSNKLDGLAAARINYPADAEMAECNNLFNIDEYDPSLPPYWTVFPAYH